MPWAESWPSWNIGFPAQAALPSITTSMANRLSRTAHRSQDPTRRRLDRTLSFGGGGTDVRGTGLGKMGRAAVQFDLWDLLANHAPTFVTATGSVLNSGDPSIFSA